MNTIRLCIAASRLAPFANHSAHRACRWSFSTSAAIAVAGVGGAPPLDECQLDSGPEMSSVISNASLIVRRQDVCAVLDVKPLQ